MLYKTILIGVISMISFQFLAGQGNNCGDTEPQLTCPNDNSLCLNESTIAPVLAVNSNLPNIEYAIVDFSIPSTSGTGPSVVAFDQDGIFTPAQYNFSPGGQLGVIPIAYNLAAIQETFDDLLKGSTVIVIFTFSCCDLILNASGVDICTTLNSAGIFCGADVTNLEQASNLFATLGGGGATTLSVADFLQQINDVNAQLADPNLPADCGGGDKVAFAFGADCVYTVNSNATFNVPADHQMSELITDYAIVSTVTVNSPHTVEYNAEDFIELAPTFETVEGATFIAELTFVCN